MKKLRFLLAFALIAGLLVAPVTALATDVSGATYSGTIIVTNNSTSAAANVSTTMTLSSADMISQGWIDSSFNNVAIINASGADVPFMPSINSTIPWSLWVPSIPANSYLNYIMYTGGGDMGSTKYYYPGSAGMQVGDSATLEPSDNFSVVLKGRFDATQSGNLTDKPGAFNLSGDGAGNITATISGATGLTTVLRPSAAGDETNITSVSGAATHWQAESDANDATYVYTSSLAYLRDLYAMEDYSNPYAVIDNAVFYFRIREENGGTETTSVTPEWKIGGSVYTGNVVQTGFGTGFSGTNTFSQTYTASPATSAAWTWTELNAAQIGISLKTTNNTVPGIAKSMDLWIVVHYHIADSVITLVSQTSGETTINASTDNHSQLFGLGTGDGADETYPLTAGLQFNLPLHHGDESGATVTSKDNNQYVGTVTGATYGTYGRTFAGAEKIKQSVADFRSTDTSGTIVVWFQKTVGQSGALFGSADEGSTSRYMFIDIGAAYKLEIQQRDGGATNNIVGDTTVNDGAWHHLVVTSNGTVYKAWVDKTAQTLTVSSGANNGNWFGDTTLRDNWTIGAVDRSSTIIPFEGVISEVRYYNTVFDQNAVDADYTATIWRTDGTVTAASNTYFQYVSNNSSVLNNSANYTLVQSAVMPYMESANISINGAQAGSWDWEYATTFTDGSGNGHTGYPTFRTTTSNANVTAALFTFAPIDTAIAPPYSVSDAPSFITGNITTSGNFTSGNVTTGIPGKDVIDAVGVASGTPNIWIWGILAGITITMGGFFISYMVRNHGTGPGELIFRVIWGALVIGLLVTFQVFDWWMLIMYLFIVFAPLIASRHQEIGASVGELNLIGFLSMAWVGLTAVNRMIEGRLITAAETAHLNNYMFTQEFTLLSVFKMPIINFSFFTKGIPSLLKWDYAFFGGNAQIIQYLLYSLTAVMAFIVLSFLAGLLTSYFSRIR